MLSKHNQYYRRSNEKRNDKQKVLQTIVQNNQIKLGPRDYYWSAFKNYLTANNISSDNLPLNYDGSEPIILDKDTKILAVTEVTQPSYHEYTEQLAGPNWTINETNITGTYTVADTELLSAKNAMKATLAQNRYNEENTIINLTVQSTPVQVSTNRGFDRDIWFQMQNLLPIGSTQVYKFSNDLWLTLTKGDIDDVVAAIVSHVQGSFDWEANISTEIDNATNKAQLEAIDLNWPVVEEK